ncbi:MAG TPA: hypothetical protein PKK26_10195 [Candidatus Wallbacteria bacterium]|nr:hypothetical protein [Candidatus Wallbacteria bacterium]
MRATNYNSDSNLLKYLNANQRTGAGLLGLNTDKTTESLNVIAQKYAAAKTKSTSSTGNVSSVISSEASNLNKVYEQIKQNGNKDALAGFNQAVMNYTKNSDATGLKNFIETGVKAGNDKNMASFVNTLAIANNISKQTPSSANQFLSEAVNTYSQSGVQSMNDYAKAASSIISKSGANSLQTSSAKASVLGNLTAAWKATSGQSKVSAAQIKTQLNDISSNVSKLGDLKTVNDYLNAKIRQVKTGI